MQTYKTKRPEHVQQNQQAHGGLRNKTHGYKGRCVGSCPVESHGLYSAGKGHQRFLNVVLTIPPVLPHRGRSWRHQRSKAGDQLGGCCIIPSKRY